MRHTREQKHAELLKAAEAMIEEFLDWEEQAAEPNLSQIEAAVLKVRRQLSERMAVVAIEDQDAASVLERLRGRGLAELAEADTDEVWLMCDGSDLRKPYAEMMPDLMQVKDLDGTLVPGYRTLNILEPV